MIVLMLDAIGVINQEGQLGAMVERLQLYDLQIRDPAASTYIRSPNRRIDYMFGCSRTQTTQMNSGTLSYIEGPQSDHGALYVNMDSTALLHYNAHDNTLQNPVFRSLKSGNPELVATYHKTNVTVLRSPSNGPPH
jgi:hypothetical protein